MANDEAFNPIHVMGATKRAAEMVISALGSSGSVIPKFKEQIEKGGPVTVTHLDIICHFMTIPEGASLVLQAGAIGESGQVDMGEPMELSIWHGT